MDNRSATPTIEHPHTEDLGDEDRIGLHMHRTVEELRAHMSSLLQHRLPEMSAAILLPDKDGGEQWIVGPVRLDRGHPAPIAQRSAQSCQRVIDQRCIGVGLGLQTLPRFVLLVPALEGERGQHDSMEELQAPPFRILCREGLRADAFQPRPTACADQFRPSSAATRASAAAASPPRSNIQSRRPSIPNATAVAQGSTRSARDIPTPKRIYKLLTILGSPKRSTAAATSTFALDRHS